MTTSTSELGDFGVLVEGKWWRTRQTIEVHSPFDGQVVARVDRAGPAEIEAAIAAATRAFETTRHLPSWHRAEVLAKIAAGLSARREEFARTIALEAGKPIRTARQEVGRAIFVFQVAAEEAKRVYGEIMPLDWLPGTEGRVAHIHRVPLGPVVGITPFNFPLNLVAHKVAPALAAGNSIIIRPASQTPVTALKLAEVVLEAGWPAEGIAVVPSSVRDAAQLVEDGRIRKLSFTGSPPVGWSLKARAGQKKVTLELGGNAGVIIHHDADLTYAAERITWGGFSYAGQSCISVQRVYAHADIHQVFLDKFLPQVQALKVGNPLDETTDIGPMIDLKSAEQVESWLTEAVASGARVLAGGQRSGSLWQPTVLTDLQEDMRVSCQEVFAPLVGIYAYTDFMAAVRAVDDSEFGLQAGLFTNDWNLMQAAFDNLEVGGLMVNDVPTFRIDHMPYGGMKASGEGREGLRYAIEEMTALKLMTFNPRAQR